MADVSLLQRDAEIMIQFQGGASILHVRITSFRPSMNYFCHIGRDSSWPRGSQDGDRAQLKRSGIVQYCVLLTLSAANSAIHVSGASNDSRFVAIAAIFRLHMLDSADRFANRKFA